MACGYELPSWIFFSSNYSNTHFLFFIFLVSGYDTPTDFFCGYKKDLAPTVPPLVLVGPLKLERLDI